MYCLYLYYMRILTIAVITVYERRWGKTQGTCCDDWLKQAPVPIQKQETCRRPDILGSAISDTMVCAGPLAGGIDTCQVCILLLT